MANPNPSPFCLVNSQVTINGVDVAAGSTVTVSLQDSAGVTQWNLTCINTDELNTAAAINASLTLSQATKTATFTAPNTLGSSLIFRSQVNNGRDPNGIAQPSFTTTFKVSVLTGANLRVFAFDESIENNASFGWLPVLNAIVRSFGANGGLLAGAGLFISGGAYNVGSADGTIQVNADSIQVSPEFYSQPNAGDTLVLRGPSGQISVGAITGTTASLTSVTTSSSISVGTTLSVTGNTTLNAVTVNGLASFGQDITLSRNTTNNILTPTVANPGLASGGITLKTGNSGNASSGDLVLQTGLAPNGSAGNIKLITSMSLVGAGSIILATTPGSVVIQGQGISLGSETPSFAGGSGVIFVPNANLNPSTAPTGGGVLFAKAGDLFWRSPSGVDIKLN